MRIASRARCRLLPVAVVLAAAMVLGVRRAGGWASCARRALGLRPAGVRRFLGLRPAGARRFLGLRSAGARRFLGLRPAGARRSCSFLARAVGRGLRAAGRAAGLDRWVSGPAELDRRMGRSKLVKAWAGLGPWAVRDLFPGVPYGRFWGSLVLPSSFWYQGSQPEKLRFSREWSSRPLGPVEIPGTVAECRQVQDGLLEINREILWQISSGGQTAI